MSFAYFKPHAVLNAVRPPCPALTVCALKIDTSGNKCCESHVSSKQFENALKLRWNCCFQCYGSASFDADPDPALTSHFNSDQDPDPTHKFYTCWIIRNKNLDLGLHCLIHCCGSGMFIPDPRSWFLPIADPGSRIQKQQHKRGVKKIFWSFM